ncbi:MAG TPA: glycosyltransferase family 2 protein [Clostridiaceae bacterium]|jgi:glycosyltransferase involved in cell wall biosynthesis|nr:glycosyltransferase family 2 protein [Clostridiaceae bacterium]
MNNFITVIVPFYCTPIDLFQRCLDSLLVDDVPNIEILVIDDGSPSSFHEVLEQMCTDKRVRLLTLPHAGVSVARNVGIKEARGEWITFVDSDDFVNSEVFKAIAENVDDLTGDVELFNGGSYRNGEKEYNTSFLEENHDYGNAREKIRIMESALSAGILPEGFIQKFSYGAPYCKLLRKSFIENNELQFDEDVRFAEDVLFMLKVYWHAKSISYHDKYLYNYVDNSQSVTRKYRPGLSIDMDIFFARMKELLIHFGLEVDLNKAYNVRVQMEIGRCFALEFFHLQSSEKDNRNRYMQFIGKEPYKEALEKDLLPKGNIRQSLYRYLCKNGYGKTYMILKKINQYIRK